MKLKWIVRICMILVLSIIMIPVFPVQASGITYYVSDDIGNDTNSGTQSAPVKTMDKALELASDGDTIYILDDIIIADATNNDAPFIIRKNVTIEGNFPTITLRAGGIILGSDVTFRNVCIGVTSFLRPGIAANGHTLTLIQVEQDTTLRPLQIYGGTFFDYSEEGFSKGTDYGEGKEIRGLISTIIIEGGKYEAIYAGSTNGSIDLPVNITVAKGSGLTLDKGIYAGSTMKDPNNTGSGTGDTGTAGQIPALDESIVLSGTVTIAMQDFNHSERIVDGVNKNHMVNLSTSGTGLYSFIVSDLDSLTVNSGTFVPAEGSSFGTTENNIPNVKLIGSSDNKATLDLSGYVSSEITVNDFTGTKNSILILASDSILTINGVLSGKNIEFRASDKDVSVAYWSSEEIPGYSGWIEYGTKYISSSQGDGTFVITNPYETQQDITFTEDSSIEAGWTTIEEPEFSTLIDFTVPSKEISYSDFNENGWVTIEVEAEFSEDEWFPYLDFIPFDYKVTYTDANNNVIEYLQQSSVDDGDGYFQCNYTSSTSEASSEDILMKFVPNTIEDWGTDDVTYSIIHTLNINKDTNTLAVGTYEISVIAETISGTITKSFILIIVNDNAVETTTTLTVPTGTPTYDYASTITVEAQVQTKSEDSNTGTPVSEGKAQLYINDVAYGEAVSVQEGSSQWSWSIPITKEKFCIGENSFKVKYFGTNDFAPSESTTTIYVKQTESSISYGAEFVSLEYAYDGNRHAFVPEAVVSIKSTDNKVTFVENAVLNEDYRIVYKVGDAFTEEPPKLVGTYPVYLTAIVTDYWIDSEIQVGNIVIAPCEPTIIFTPKEFNYTQGTNSITASGTIELEVVGAEGGLNPEGTVTIVAEDDGTDEPTKITIADISLKDGKATINFSDVEPKNLYFFSFSYTPTPEAPYTSISGDYQARFVTVNSSESADYTLNGVTKAQLYFAEGQEITVNAGTKKRYSFKEWSISSEKEIVMLEGNISTSIVKFTMPNGDVSLTAIWNPLSSDTSLQSVSVSGITGEINGNTINVVLPYTTEVLPTNTEDIFIAPTDDCASVKDLKTENEGKIWTFIVEAEDKTTQKYTINVSIADRVILEGYSVRLDGKIGLNFHMLLNDGSLKEDSYMKFTWNGEEVTISTESIQPVTVNGKTYYVFSCEVAAKEMADVITAKFYNSNNTCLMEKQYSVKEYAQVIIENKDRIEEYANAIPLVKAMLNYGAYAQQYFDYNESNLANNITDTNDDVLISDTEKDLSSITVDKFTSSKVSAMTIDGIGTFAGATLALESETTLNIYFTLADSVSIEDLTFSVDGNTISPKLSGEYYVIPITNIKANNIDKVFAISVTKGEETETFRCSVYAYCYSVLSDTKSQYKDELKNTLKALYYYNMAADAYIK